MNIFSEQKKNTKQTKQKHKNEKQIKQKQTNRNK